MPRRRRNERLFSGVAWAIGLGGVAVGALSILATVSGDEEPPGDGGAMPVIAVTPPGPVNTNAGIATHRWEAQAWEDDTRTQPITSSILWDSFRFGEGEGRGPGVPGILETNASGQQVSVSPVSGYSNPGIYTIKAQVTNSQGVTAKHEITVTVN